MEEDNNRIEVNLDEDHNDELKKFTGSPATYENALNSMRKQKQEDHSDFQQTSKSGYSIKLGAGKYRYNREDGRGERANPSTPETKLSSKFSRLNTANKRASNSHELEGADTFITSADYNNQMALMDERVTKLENLIWDLYKELNNKIENSVAHVELQLNENKLITDKIFDKLNSEVLTLKANITKISPVESASQDDGYNGSDEYEGEPVGEGEQQFVQGTLDEVAEEMSSQYCSEREIFHQNESYEKSVQVIEPSRDVMPLFHHISGSKIPKKKNDDIRLYTFEGGRYNYDQTDKKLSPESSDKQMRDSENLNEEGEGDDELDYYFSCHERMIKDYENDSRDTSRSNVFKNINKDELRYNVTMPDLSRSTLVDQIDYDLDNYKVNESSVLESSSDDGFHSNRNPNCSNLRENKQVCPDVQPKLMGFLNSEKIK